MKVTKIKQARNGFREADPTFRQPEEPFGNERSEFQEIHESMCEVCGDEY